MTIDRYWYTNLGTKMENEDSCGCFSPGQDQYCAVVCDGLGGHGGGSAASAPAAAVTPAAADNFAQAMAALTGLGYTPAEARDALQKVGNKEAPADELLRLALRSMAGF